MSKLLKNSSSQSLNVIHIKNIFINPKLIIPKKLSKLFRLLIMEFFITIINQH